MIERPASIREIDGIELFSSGGSTVSQILQEINEGVVDDGTFELFTSGMTGVRIYPDGRGFTKVFVDRRNGVEGIHFLRPAEEGLFDDALSVISSGQLSGVAFGRKPIYSRSDNIFDQRGMVLVNGQTYSYGGCQVEEVGLVLGGLAKNIVSIRNMSRTVTDRTLPSSIPLSILQELNLTY